VKKDLVRREASGVRRVISGTLGLKVVTLRFMPFALRFNPLTTYALRLTDLSPYDLRLTTYGCFAMSYEPGAMSHYVVKI